MVTKHWADLRETFGEKTWDNIGSEWNQNQNESKGNYKNIIPQIYLRHFKKVFKEKFNTLTREIINVKAIIITSLHILKTMCIFGK